MRQKKQREILRRSFDCVAYETPYEYCCCVGGGLISEMHATALDDLKDTTKLLALVSSFCIITLERYMFVGCRRFDTRRG